MKEKRKIIIFNCDGKENVTLHDEIRIEKIKKNSMPKSKLLVDFLKWYASKNYSIFADAEYKRKMREIKESKFVGIKRKINKRRGKIHKKQRRI